MKHGSTRIRKAFFSVFHPSTQMSHFEQGISNTENGRMDIPVRLET